MKKYISILLIALVAITCLISCDHEIGTVSGNASVKGISLDKTTLSLAPGLSATLTATITPSNATNQNITWTSSAESVATVTAGVVSGITEGEATITAIAEDGGYTAVCTVTVATKGTTDGHDWVQLWDGGPRFATMNVGSTASNYSGADDYTTAYVGDYYKWGAITARSSGTKSNSTTDIQGTDDDTAKAIWGSNWQMPTKSDLDNLLNTANCILEWCDGEAHATDGDGHLQYVSGCTLVGYKVTGKGAFANNSIFLPCAGLYSNSTLYSKGESGDYFSSTQYGESNAWVLYLEDSENHSVCAVPRNNECSVRAICVEQ